MKNRVESSSSLCSREVPSVVVSSGFSTRAMLSGFSISSQLAEISNIAMQDSDFKLVYYYIAVASIIFCRRLNYVCHYLVNCTTI